MKYFWGLILLLCHHLLQAQTINDIVERHIQAIGGRQAWDKIQEIKYTETQTDEYNTLKMNKKISVTGNLRIDFLFPERMIVNRGQEKFYVQIDHHIGTKHLPEQTSLQKQDTLTTDEINYWILASNLFDPFCKQTYADIKLLPDEIIQDEIYYKLWVTWKNQTQSYIYIAASTYLIYKRIDLLPEIESFTTYVSYQKLPNGIVIPATINTQAGTSMITDIILQNKK